MQASLQSASTPLAAQTTMSAEFVSAQIEAMLLQDASGGDSLQSSQISGVQGASSSAALRTSLMTQTASSQAQSNVQQGVNDKPLGIMNDPDWTR